MPKTEKSQSDFLNRLANESGQIENLLDSVLNEEVEEDIFVIDYERETSFLVYEGKTNATFTSHLKKN